MFSIVKYFEDDVKLIKRGENALKSGHVRSFMFDDGVINLILHSSVETAANSGLCNHAAAEL